MTYTGETMRWTGAYATTRLVGRVDVLAQVREALTAQPALPQVIYLFGDGGIGKTRLMLEILHRLCPEVGATAARELVDLYDSIYHSSGGLAQAIFERLTPPYQPFESFEKEYRLLSQMEASGAIADVGEQRERMLDVFVTDLRAFAAGRRVVIALDTAERLVYTGDEIPGVPAEIAEGWTWLLKALPRLPNVTLIVAGREQARPLGSTEHDLTGVDIWTISLEPLKPEESQDYFDAAVEAAHERGYDDETAERLADLPPETRALAHQCAGGRPILLALLADLLTLQGFGAINRLLDKQHSVGETSGGARLADELEAATIERLITTPRLGETLVAVGRLPKGAEERLLAALLQSKGMTPGDVREQLAELKRLSFVKVRQDRVFLHDELYAMLNRHVYSTPPDRRDAITSLDIILEYYEHLNDNWRREVDEVYRPIEVERRPDQLNRVVLAELNARHRSLVSEAVSYRLRRNGFLGFQDYFRQTFIAILSGDTALDVQLQAEILTFLRERDPDGHAEFVDDLERGIVLGVALIRPVARAFAEQNHPRAVELARTIRQHKPRQLAAGGPSTQAALGIWEAYALTYLGGDEELRQARVLLDQSIDLLQQAPTFDREQMERSKARRWHTRSALAFGYQVRAYLRWTYGDLNGAIADYRRAAELWREAQVDVNLATALNDLGFAMAELGYFADARALVGDALQIRRRLGPRTPVGYSINTLALVDIREGSFLSGMERSEEALIIFKALDYLRGVALAQIALAEASRRYSGTDQVTNPEEKVKLLRAARDYAREAQAIARDTGEMLRRVSALIEVGCAMRDWVRVRIGAPSSRDSVPRLIAESRDALEDAAQLAGDTFLYRKIDALVNLALLEFYAGNLDAALKAADRALAAFPEGYEFEIAIGRPARKMEGAHVQLWAQLGKLHTLYGHVGFERYQRHTPTSIDRQQHLDEAVQNYMFSLEYNSIYSPDHPGLRRATDQIYERLKLLPTADLRLVATRIHEIEGSYNLEQSVLQRALRNRALWYED